jgi:hypothetical protein
MVRGRSFRAAIALLFGCVLATGCYAPAWTVVRDTNAPSPLRGAGVVTVSFDYSRLALYGMSEPEWVQSKLVEDPSYAQTWSSLKQAFEVSFLSNFRHGWPPGAQAGPPGQPGAHLFVVPVHMTIGHFMGVVETATSVSTAMFFQVDGRDVAEIDLNGQQWATLYRPSVHQHMTSIGAYLGESAGHFVASKN